MEPITNNYTTVAASNEQAFSQHGTSSESSMFKNNNDNNNNNGNGDSAAQKITAVEDSIDSSSATINIDENNLETVEEDPFLLVSLRKTAAPIKPKCVNILYLFAILDLSLVSLYMIYSLIKHNGDLKSYQWGLVILCFIRFITVMCIASSNKIRELRSILAGVCCVSDVNS
nr:370_t:CDS:1 [Entrophospora candida]